MEPFVFDFINRRVSGPHEIMPTPFSTFDAEHPIAAPSADDEHLIDDD